MDKILEMAKDLGYTIQEDPRYLKTKAAQDAADADEELQALIGEFNLKRMAINTESSKDAAEQDKEKLTALNTEIRDIYGKVMANAHMQAYNAAKTELDKMTGAVMAILNMSVQGLDPDTYEESAGCTGNCGSCGGCH